MVTKKNNCLFFLTRAFLQMPGNNKHYYSQHSAKCEHQITSSLHDSMHSQKVSKSQGGTLNSGEHSFSAQSLIKRQGASWNGPPSHPSLLKLSVGAATRSTSLKALDQFRLPFLNNNERERRVLGNRILFGVVIR